MDCILVTLNVNDDDDNIISTDTWNAETWAEWVQACPGSDQTR